MGLVQGVGFKETGLRLSGRGFPMTEESSIAEGDDIFSSENEIDPTSTNPNQNTSEEEATINQAINIIDNSMASETDENMQPSENTSDEECSDNQQETEENSSDLI